MSPRIKADDETLTVRQVREAINRHVTLKRDRDRMATELLLGRADR